MIISVEPASLFKRLALRFIRTFISGGLASVTVQLATVPQLNTLTEWKTYGVALLIGFMAGGLAALEKWTREQ